MDFHTHIIEVVHVIIIFIMCKQLSVLVFPWNDAPQQQKWMLRDFPLCLHGSNGRIADVTADIPDNMDGANMTSCKSKHWCNLTGFEQNEMNLLLQI